MSADSINVDRLRAALEHITAHPEEWKQDNWAERTACGTACCLGGTVALQAGYELNWKKLTKWNPETCTHEPTDKWFADYILSCDDYPHGAQIAEVSNDLLEVSAISGDRLYNCSNTLLDLWRIANSITGGVIEVPRDLPTTEEDANA